MQALHQAHPAILESRDGIIPLMRKLPVILCGVLLMMLVACQLPQPPATESPQTYTPAPPTNTPTPAPPTPTPAPLAAEVNGEGILLAEYEAELARVQAADAELGLARTTEEEKQLALDALIDSTLLAQAAYQNGFTLNESDFAARYAQLVIDADGEEQLNQWLAANFYTVDSLKTALRREIAAAWQRDQIIQAVPRTAEQIHARQILVRRENEAQSLHRQLTAQGGANFDDLAFIYDPTLGGDLGWFPRGYLYQPAVETAAFDLEAGQFSGVIATSYGYHIIKVIERDPQRLLSADALLVYQRQGLENWMQRRRAESTISIFVP